MKAKKSRPFRLHELDRLRLDSSQWVVCRDNLGRVWTVPEKCFRKFRYTGFPFIPNKQEEAIHKIFSSSEYFRLHKKRRMEVIRNLLSAFSERPIEEVLPSFE